MKNVLKNPVNPLIISSVVLAIFLVCCTSADVEPLSPTPIEDTPSSSSSAPSEPTPNIPSAPDSLADVRDGQKYKTVRIGNQIWMAENLNYNDGSSVCYDNDPLNCETYGRLYDWDAAMVACPNSWYLPSIDEWDALINSVGGRSTADRYLKATNGWNDSSNGLDSYEFAALPGGSGYSGSNFNNVGNRGDWWSSTEGSGSSNYGAHYMSILYNHEYVFSSHGDKKFLHSVRCVQD
jgi:uncharacterized protein (TIGR02145 family)